MLRTIDAETFLIPESKEEWDGLKGFLISHHGLEDRPETWTFVLSQLQGVKMPELTTTFTNIVSHYKRWKIAKVLQDQKLVYLQALEDKLKAALEAEAKKDEGASSKEEDWTHTVNVPGGASNPEPEVPKLPNTEEGVVSDPSQPGIQ